jgi:hypothetical protein
MAFKILSPVSASGLTVRVVFHKMKNPGTTRILRFVAEPAGIQLIPGVKTQ